MNDTPAQGAQAEFEALRARWEKAKANGTVEAFAQDLFEQSELVPPPPDRVYESAEERAAYDWARESFPVTAADLLALLPLYFGDEKGVSMERVLAELEAEAANGRSGGRQDVPAE